MEKIARAPRAEKLYANLKHRLAAGEFTPGQSLPTLQDLCQIHGVSINTARKAVGLLVREGCLVAKPGAGIHVRDNAAEDAASFTDIISLMCHLDEKDLCDVQQHALDAGLLLCPISKQTPHYEPAIERRFLEQVLKSRHRGLLANCTPSQPDNLDLIEKLSTSGVRVLHINHHSPELPKQSYILPDYRKAGYMAAAHLMMGGYKRLAFVGMTHEWPSAGVFRQGFREAVMDFRHEFSDDKNLFLRDGGFLQYGNPTIDEFKDFLQQGGGSLGLVVVTHGLATLVQEHASACGLSVPGQVGIVSTVMIDHLGGNTFDSVSFAYTDILRSAIDAITAPVWCAPKQLVAPQLLRRGSVRAEGTAR